MLIDTHCHIHDPNCFTANPEEAIRHAQANSVEKIIVIGTDPQDSAVAANFANSHQGVWWTFGYHPNDFDGDTTKLNQDLAVARTLFQNSKLIAIGEIGLDYHFAGYNSRFQIALLERMLQLAQDYHLPVSFHVRDAFQDFWPIYDNFHLVPSVMHSFSDSPANLAEALRRNLTIGVNGLSTFANLPHAPLECIVFETDAPFLTPKPFRGKINRPGYVKNIAEWASAHYQLDFATVSQVTTDTAERIFKI